MAKGKNKELYDVHIFSVGESINDTFRRALRSQEFRVDAVHILYDKDSFRLKRDNEITRKIKNNIQKVKKRCEEDLIDYNLVLLDEITTDNILHAVMDIKNSYEEDDDRGVNFHSNITGGNKIASIGLFLASIWINSIPYYLGISQREPMILSIPNFNPLDFSNNMNYFTILKLLREKSRGMTNTDIRKIMNDRDDYKVQRKGMASGVLTPGNLSTMLRYLEEKRLISIAPGKSRRENEVKITNDGELLLKLKNY